METLKRLLVFTMCYLLAFPASLMAGPVDGQVVAGQAEISTNGPETRIDQSSRRAVVDWRSFDIDPGEAVRHQMPDPGSAALHRVKGGGGASQLAGELTSNGNIFLVNPAGVVVHEGAKVDVGGFVASTRDISDENFMKENLVFDRPGQPGAAVVNRGEINVRDRGLAALVAPSVRNEGLVAARLGRVALASGDSTYKLDPYGDDLIGFEVAEDEVDRLHDAGGNPLGVENSGVVKAEGGVVVLSASQLDSIVSSVVNNSGTVSVDSAEAKGGRVVFKGRGENVDVINTGTVTASSAQGDGGTVRMVGDSKVAVSGRVEAKGGSRGGRVDVSGKAETLIESASISVEGREGGLARLGGEFQGGRADADEEIWRDFVGRFGETDALAATGKLIVDSASTISAGLDGSLIIWSGDLTLVDGGLEGRFVETSGQRLFVKNPPKMNDGTWLLDPIDIIVGNFSNIDDLILNSGEYIVESSINFAYIDAYMITNYLLNNNVSLYADNSIIINSKIGNSLSFGNLSLFSDNITINGNLKTKGYINILPTYDPTDLTRIGNKLDIKSNVKITDSSNIVINRFQNIDIGSQVELNGDSLTIGADKDVKIEEKVQLISKSKLNISANNLTIGNEATLEGAITIKGKNKIDIGTILFRSYDEVNISAEKSIKIGDMTDTYSGGGHAHIISEILEINAINVNYSAFILYADNITLKGNFKNDGVTLIHPKKYYLDPYGTESNVIIANNVKITFNSYFSVGNFQNINIGSQAEFNKISELVLIALNTLKIGDNVQFILDDYLENVEIGLLAREILTGTNLQITNNKEIISDDIRFIISTDKLSGNIISNIPVQLFNLNQQNSMYIDEGTRTNPVIIAPAIYFNKAANYSNYKGFVLNKYSIQTSEITVANNSTLESAYLTSLTSTAPAITGLAASWFETNYPGRVPDTWVDGPWLYKSVILASADGRTWPYTPDTEILPKFVSLSNLPTSGLNGFWFDNLGYLLYDHAAENVNININELYNILIPGNNSIYTIKSDGTLTIDNDIAISNTTSLDFSAIDEIVLNGLINISSGNLSITSINSNITVNGSILLDTGVITLQAVNGNIDILNNISYSIAPISGNYSSMITAKNITIGPNVTLRSKDFYRTLLTLSANKIKILNNSTIMANDILLYTFGDESNISSGADVKYIFGYKLDNISASFQSKTISFDENTLFNVNGTLFFSDRQYIDSQGQITNILATNLSFKKGSNITSTQTIFYIDEFSAELDGKKSLVTSGDVIFGYNHWLYYPVNLLTTNSTRDFPLIDTTGIVKFMYGEYVLPEYFLKSAKAIIWELGTLRGQPGYSPHIFDVSLNSILLTHGFTTLRIEYNDIPSASLPSASAQEIVSLNISIIDKIVNDFKIIKEPLSYSDSLATVYNRNQYNINYIKQRSSDIVSGGKQKLLQRMENLDFYSNDIKISLKGNEDIYFTAKRVGKGQCVQLVKDIITNIPFDFPDTQTVRNKYKPSLTYTNKTYTYSDQSYPIDNPTFTISLIPTVGSIFLEPLANSSDHTGIVMDVKIIDEDNGIYEITLLEQNYNLANSKLSQNIIDEYNLNDPKYDSKFSYGAELYTESDQGEEVDPHKINKEWSQHSLGIMTTTRTFTVNLSDIFGKKESDDEKTKDTVIKTPQEILESKWYFVTTPETVKYDVSSEDDPAMNEIIKTIFDTGIAKYNIDDKISVQEQDEKLNSFIMANFRSEDRNKAFEAINTISNVYATTVGKSPDIIPLISHAEAYLKLSPSEQKEYLYYLSVGVLEPFKQPNLQ